MTRLENSPGTFKINLIQDDTHSNLDLDNEPVSSALYTDLFEYCMENALKDKYIPFKCTPERLSFQSKNGLEIWNISNADDGQLQISCMERMIIEYVPLYREDGCLISPYELKLDIYFLIVHGELDESKIDLFEIFWRDTFELVQELKLQQREIDRDRYKHSSAEGIVLKNGLKFRKINY